MFCQPTRVKKYESHIMTLAKFKEYCGTLGGYEADFLYLCWFITSFAEALKSPQWTFVGLRTALESDQHDPILRDIMRRCFVLSGRNIIGMIFRSGLVCYMHRWHGRCE